MKRLIICGFSMLVFACSDRPKVVNASSESNTDEVTNETFTSDQLFRNTPSNSASATSDAVHTVSVKEVLPTARYVYLRVTEGENEFWIATRKMPVTKGGVYYYKGGLLKKNFESKEYSRTFETLYLVNQLVPHSHAQNQENQDASSFGNNAEEKAISEPESSTPEGVMSIAKIVSDPQKYAGKRIQVSGKVVKINPNILNRHWIHLQDGTKDDYDLVVTTNTRVQEGQNVTFLATVSLNKDFGAGYTYELILEDGVVQ